MVILRKKFPTFPGCLGIINNHTRSSGRPHALFFLAWITSAAVVGCAAPRRTTPSVNAETLPDESFQAYLASLDVVAVDEAYRAMLILADGEDTCKTFEERKLKLESRGIAKSAWNLQPQNVIDCGSVAYMICKICKITGGVDLVTFAAAGIGDRRYAMRELIYREMLENVVDYQYMTGSRLVGVLAKADALMAKKKLYPTQGIDLSDQTDRDAQGNLIVPKPANQPPGS